MRVSLDKRPHVWRKLSKELIDKFVSDVARGAPISRVRKKYRLTNSIVYAWFDQGDLDFEADLDTLPAYLVESLANVECEEIIWCRQKIKESDKGHKGAEWTLEHAYWRDYSTNAANVDFNERLENLEEKKKDEAEK